MHACLPCRSLPGDRRHIRPASSACLFVPPPCFDAISARSHKPKPSWLPLLPGITTWSFIVNDTYGQSATGYVTITSPPGAPAAAADAYNCSFNATCTVAVGAGVLANDATPNAAGALAVAAASATQPAHGNVTVAADGSFTYTPDQ